MTNDTQASGPDKGPREEPLYIDPAAKSPYYDYQWHPVEGVIGPGFRAYSGDTGWIPVARPNMQDEPSDSEEFIQRRELRLFYRLRKMSETARAADLAMAMSQLEQADTCRRVTGFPGIQGNIRVPARDSAPALPLDRRWWEHKTRIAKHRRGRLLIVHEATLPKKWRAWAARHQYTALRWRIVYLTLGESDVANLQCTSYTDWGWAKIDLYRERAIPHPGNPLVSHRQAKRRR